MVNVPIECFGVTMTEIPNEIALYFNIGNCFVGCEGCHSPELWDLAHSTYWNSKDILKKVNEYEKDVTAVLFMGGNRNAMDFDDFVEYVIYPVSKILPVGIYMGDWNELDLSLALKYCRWVKIGKYDKSRGGLDSKNTNQRFLEVQNYKFQGSNE